jgi:hypothetical protein
VGLGVRQITSSILGVSVQDPPRQGGPIRRLILPGREDLQSSFIVKAGAYGWAVNEWLGGDFLGKLDYFI